MGCPLSLLSNSPALIACKSCDDFDYRRVGHEQSGASHLTQNASSSRVSLFLQVFMLGSISLQIAFPLLALVLYQIILWARRLVYCHL
jgi:hypothetical protein